MTLAHTPEVGINEIGTSTGQQQMKLAQKLRVATMKWAAQTLKGGDNECKI